MTGNRTACSAHATSNSRPPAASRTTSAGDHSAIASVSDSMPNVSFRYPRITLIDDTEISTTSVATLMPTQTCSGASASPSCRIAQLLM